MIECGSLEYAQARIGARQGERLRESDWQRIEVLRDLGPLLDMVRGTSLRPWVAGIDASSDAHRIESALRARWRAIVAEAAGWMPARWRPAVSWWTSLPELAPLQHLARGDEPPAWMRDDETWRDICAAAPAARAARLAEGPLAPLAPAWSAPQTLAHAWQAEWRRRWPDGQRNVDELLEPVAFAWIMRGKPIGVATGHEAWLRRGSLRSRLALLMRRATLRPAAAFIHLVLCAIDLEQLRAELLRRVLFARWKAA
ncbi:MAG TPA: hypothetical protein VMU47_03550 [Caldimonas sp.]|nr:hypothetical protein [Caldimonas sp.]